MRQSADELSTAASPARRAKSRKWRSLGRKLLITLLILIGLLAITRPMMPWAVRWYVNRTLDRSPIYQGKIGEVNLHLWRGAYSVRDVRLVKMTGDVPVPLYSAERVDFEIQWDALAHGKVVGQVVMHRPELNFVAAPSEADSQTGAGGPWLAIIRDLFPFKINRTRIRNGAVHFRTYATSPPADLYLSHFDGDIDNLTNVRGETTPLLTTVHATALAMDQAKFEYNMRLDPFSYRPTFHLATRLIGLDVTKTNGLAVGYGGFDFERGWFDLVVEVDAKEGQLAGYVKPLFRNLKILALPKDLKQDNPIQFFWEALVGVTTAILKNQSRDQFGTLIPFTGSAEGSTNTDILATIVNVLRNAFVRAYLPRLQNQGLDAEGMHFSPGSVDEATSGVDTP